MGGTTDRGSPAGRPAPSELIHCDGSPQISRRPRKVGPPKLPTLDSDAVQGDAASNPMNNVAGGTLAGRRFPSARTPR